MKYQNPRYKTTTPGAIFASPSTLQMDYNALVPEALDSEVSGLAINSSKPVWRPRKDRVPATHHSKEKKSGRGSAKNQLHKLFKREYLVKADIKRSADRFGEWVERREREDGRDEPESEERDEREWEEERPRDINAANEGLGDEIWYEEEVAGMGTGDLVWDEEAMRAVEDEDRRAWEAILLERERKDESGTNSGVGKFPTLGS